MIRFQGDEVSQLRGQTGSVEKIRDGDSLLGAFSSNSGISSAVQNIHREIVPYCEGKNNNRYPPEWADFISIIFPLVTTSPHQAWV